MAFNLQLQPTPKRSPYVEQLLQPTEIQAFSKKAQIQEALLKALGQGFKGYFAGREEREVKEKEKARGAELASMIAGMDVSQDPSIAMGPVQDATAYAPRSRTQRLQYVTESLAGSEDPQLQELGMNIALQKLLEKPEVAKAPTMRKIPYQTTEGVWMEGVEEFNTITGKWEVLPGAERPLYKPVEEDKTVTVTGEHLHKLFTDTDGVQGVNVPENQRDNLYDWEPGSRKAASVSKDPTSQGEREFQFYIEEFGMDKGLAADLAYNNIHIDSNPLTRELKIINVRTGKEYSPEEYAALIDSNIKPTEVVAAEPEVLPAIESRGTVIDDLSAYGGLPWALDEVSAIPFVGAPAGSLIRKAAQYFGVDAKPTPEITAQRTRYKTFQENAIRGMKQATRVAIPEQERILAMLPDLGFMETPNHARPILTVVRAELERVLAIQIDTMEDEGLPLETRNLASNAKVNLTRALEVLGASPETLAQDEINTMTLDHLNALLPKLDTFDEETFDALYRRYLLLLEGSG